MIVYLKMSKNQQKTLLELISDYNKVAGYQLNIKKVILFLFTNNEQLEFYIKNTIPFILVHTPKILIQSMYEIYMRKIIKLS